MTDDDTSLPVQAFMAKELYLLWDVGRSAYFAKGEMGYTSLVECAEQFALSDALSRIFGASIAGIPGEALALVMVPRELRCPDPREGQNGNDKGEGWCGVCEVDRP